MMFCIVVECSNVIKQQTMECYRPVCNEGTDDIVESLKILLKCTIFVASYLCARRII